MATPNIINLSPAARGLGRGSIVYQGVDIDSQGRVVPEHWDMDHGYTREELDLVVGTAVFKGVLLREGNSSSANQSRVSFLPTALGNSAISEGTKTWSGNRYIFSPGEAVDAIAELGRNNGVLPLGRMANLDDLPNLAFVIGAPETLTDQIEALDRLVDDRPLGNLLLNCALGIALNARPYEDQI